jgi:geranylgeranyl diphosphate synthase type I
MFAMHSTGRIGTILPRGTVEYASDVDIRAEFSRLVNEIESEMRSVLAERDGHARPLYEMLAYHLGLDADDGPRGKRLRPLLGLLAYQSLGGDYREALPGAAAVELGHNFSLVHDDIEDADRARRGRATLWALWGVPLAINAGDALFALSRLVLYRLVDTGRYDDHVVLRMMRVYDETCLALCEGQYLDISFETRTDVSVDEYFEMIGKKTAALLGSAVQAGAILASAEPAVVEAYRRCGYDLGMAFQMADDLKGAFWASADSGKPEAGDIRKRKKLPLVWALAHASDADAARLRELYSVAADAEERGPMPDTDVAETLAILDRCGARDHATAEARRYRDLALARIDGLPCDERARAQLRFLVEMVIAP